LSSSTLYSANVTKKLKNSIINKFNNRTNNLHGENIRFILLDGGFKEGIDLFDCKYFHILQVPDYKEGLKQVIGRATRFCGNSGLEFKENEGWKLKIYFYDKEVFSFEKDQTYNEYFYEKTLQGLPFNERVVKKLETTFNNTLINNAVDKMLFQ